MTSKRVDFGHAFERWHAITKQEAARLDELVRQKKTVVSWEALDHLCGLAAESGIKALLFHIKTCRPDEDGDFPRDSMGQRPHINKLWDQFERAVQGRQGAHIWRALGAPPALFSSWETAHRYAPNGTVDGHRARERADFLRKLHQVLSDEMVF
ncbi:MAG: hypothetical protein MUF64_00810 [Polyangiaceae bacterium]|jgi:hypothetical protein|nr:hypothetical protein [Polyangiaceae bacterium]